MTWLTLNKLQSLIVGRETSQKSKKIIRKIDLQMFIVFFAWMICEQVYPYSYPLDKTIFEQFFGGKIFFTGQNLLAIIIFNVVNVTDISRHDSQMFEVKKITKTLSFCLKPTGQRFA